MPEREIRRRALQAVTMLDEGIREHYPSKVFALFSGGDDSLTATKIASAHPRFTGVIHLDTGTGVPQTQEFVIETCRREGWPLKIYRAPEGEYERLVLNGHTTRNGVTHRGFPHGPKSHLTFYNYLKKKQIYQAIREHKAHRHDRIGFVAGIRIPESTRRAKSKMARWHYQEPDHAHVWLHPILDWTKPDCLEFLDLTHTPRNPVSVNCHRSGECLCGALANRAELDEIAFFYPEVGARYHALMEKAKGLGIEANEWAGGYTKTRRTTARSTVTLPLCTSCQLGSA